MTKNGFHLGGRIRTFPYDFIVEEIWKDRVCEIRYGLLERVKNQVLGAIQKEKDYLHFTLIKQNWDTIRALNYVGKKIHVSLKRFGISGMKDKRALTSQRVSLWKGNVGSLIRLRLNDIYLKDFEYSDERINLGEAIGNRFTITIRNISKSKKDTNQCLTKFGEEVTSKGIPNYFGPQRFGISNAKIGRAIRDGDLQHGIKLIIQKAQPYLEEGSIENIPRSFWYEKRVLHHLKKYPNDYAGALRRIPKRILRIYTHAYQALIFNKKLKKNLIEGKTPKWITMPGFHVPKMPELSTYSVKRRSFLIAKNFKIIRVGEGMITIRFSLGRGEYASTLLSHLVDI